MTVRDFLHLAGRYWIVLTALTLAGLFAGLGAGLLQQPQYQSTTKVYVSTPGASGIDQADAGNSYAQDVVKGYADLVPQPLVLDRVAQQLGLGTNGAALASRVDASAVEDTSGLVITATDPSPQRAARIADAAAASLSVVVDRITPRPAGATSSTVRLTVTQPATTPSRPVSPNVPGLAVLGLLVGLVVGLLIVFLREALDTRVRSDADVRAVSDRPVLGAIGFDRTAAAAPLVVQADPHGLRAETFRTLRTNMQFLGLEQPDNAVVFTSSISGEGKSTTATNLAIITADTGASVLLIDADLRRPKLAEYLGIDGGVGLSDVLSGQVEAEDAVQRWGDRELTVLASGSVPPNPSELLGGRRMTELLETVCAQYDLVILDAPPLLPVSDAAVLARKTAGAIVVCALNRAHKGQLAASLTALAGVEASVLGVVETMVPARRTDGYGYGYGYGHAAEPSRPSEPRPPRTRTPQEALNS